MWLVEAYVLYFTFSVFFISCLSQNQELKRTQRRLPKLVRFFFSYFRIRLDEFFVAEILFICWLIWKVRYKKKYPIMMVWILTIMLTAMENTQWTLSKSNGCRPRKIQIQFCQQISMIPETKTRQSAQNLFQLHVDIVQGTVMLKVRRVTGFGDHSTRRNYTQSLETYSGKSFTLLSRWTALAPAG